MVFTLLVFRLLQSKKRIQKGVFSKKFDNFQTFCKKRGVCGCFSYKKIVE